MLQGVEDPATKIMVSWIGVIGVVSAAVITLIGALFTVRYTRKNHRESLRLQEESLKLQRELKARESELAIALQEARTFADVKLAEKKQEFDRGLAQKRADFDLQLEVKSQVFQEKLEAIKARFEDENAEKSARRAYEYDARQRLYKDIEPLLFQLSEQGETALYRIAQLAEWAKDGNILPTGGWLSDPKQYHAALTIYILIAPLTSIKLMQRKLTAVDLSLIQRINDLYTIAKLLYWSFTDHFVVKEIARLEYDPNHVDSATLREGNPRVYWRQGLPMGEMEKVVESLIDKNGQCKSFGVFETEFSNGAGSQYKSVFDIFRNFHPQTRPILWRILIIQAHLYYCLLLNRNSGPAAEKIIPVIPLRAVKGIGVEFDWRTNDQMPEEEVLVHPFETAEAYLRGRLKHLYRDLPASSIEFGIAPQPDADAATT